MKDQLQLNLGEIEWSGREPMVSLGGRPSREGPTAPWMMTDLATSPEDRNGQDTEILPQA